MLLLPNLDDQVCRDRKRIPGVNPLGAGGEQLERLCRRRDRAQHGGGRHAAVAPAQEVARRLRGGRRGRHLNRRRERRRALAFVLWRRLRLLRLQLLLLLLPLLLR